MSADGNRGETVKMADKVNGKNYIEEIKKSHYFRILWLILTIVFFAIATSLTVSFYFNASNQRLTIERLSQSIDLLSPNYKCSDLCHDCTLIVINCSDETHSLENALYSMQAQYDRFVNKIFLLITISIGSFTIFAIAVPIFNIVTMRDELRKYEESLKKHEKALEEIREDYQGHINQIVEEHKGDIASIKSDQDRLAEIVEKSQQAGSIDESLDRTESQVRHLGKMRSGQTIIKNERKTSRPFVIDADENKIVDIDFEEMVMKKRDALLGDSFLQRTGDSPCGVTDGERDD